MKLKKDIEVLPINEDDARELGYSQYRRCKNCTKAVFYNREKMISHHLAEHKQIGRCSSCGETFHTTGHMRSHHDRKVDCIIKGNYRDRKPTE